MLQKILPNTTRRVLAGVKVHKVNQQFRALSTVASVYTQPNFNLSSSVTNPNVVSPSQELTPTYTATRDNLRGTFEALSKMKAVDYTLADERRSRSPEFDVLMKRQLKIEEEQLVEASALYQETFENLAKMGKGSTLKSAQKLLLQWYEPLVASLKKEFDDIAKGTVSDQRNVSFLVTLPAWHEWFVHTIIRLICVYYVFLVGIWTVSGTIACGKAGHYHLNDHAELRAPQRKSWRETHHDRHGDRQHG